MSTSIAELAEILQKLLIEDANCIGRETGFIQRQRKLSGASFAQALIFGWQANPQASLEELCQSASQAGVSISPQGLQERLNSPRANEFLHRLLLRSLEYLVEGQTCDAGLLRRFGAIYLQDSSKVELPAQFESLWKGNQQGQSTLKIQTVLDYRAGRLEFQLAQGRQHDCPLQKTDLPAGSLRLADVAYFKVKVFEELNERKVFWLSRLPARVGIWQGEKVIHVLDWLKQQEGDEIDQVVELTAQRLKARLIAVRVPETVAAERRKRVKESARSRRHSQLKAETLELCEWTILVTNLTAEQLTVLEALCLLRLRWQIELLFKLWKHSLSLDEWRSKQAFQIMSEVYAKLLLALIQHWLMILGTWEEDDRSLVKACLLLKKQAFHLLSVLHDFSALVQALNSILPHLSRCKIQKRKARPATFQLLGLAHSLT
jgi:hypothetical protein